MMTRGATEETCGGQKKAEGRAGGGSFTTLSTIAVQAGRSQIVVSVLKVGKDSIQLASSIISDPRSITGPPAVHLNGHLTLAWRKDDGFTY